MKVCKHFKEIGLFRIYYLLLAYVHVVMILVTNISFSNLLILNISVKWGKWQKSNKEVVLNKKQCEVEKQELWNEVHPWHERNIDNPKDMMEKFFNEIDQVVESMSS